MRNHSQVFGPSPRLGALSIVKLASIGVLAGAAAASVGCDEKRPPGAPAPTGAEWINHSAPLGDAGTYVDDGEACDEEGVQVECGKVVEQHDDYLTCSMGTRTCTEGVWSACIGERMTQVPVPESSAGLRPLALGSSGACPAGLDPCDPYCHQIIDTPGNFTAGTNLSNTSLGVTPLPTGIGNCTSLTLTPSTSTLNVTALSPLTVSGNPVTFTLTAAPSGCADPNFVTTWSVDKLDRATMSASTAVNTGGRLTLAVPIAGTLKVTAFAHGLNVSTNIAVKVNVVDAPATAGAAAVLSDPANGVTSAGNIALFSSGGVPLAGTSPSTASWLYPYGTTPGTCATCLPTYFPLGLPAPVVQYAYSAGLGKAVKLSLRYPVNSTASTATFNYSIIVKESNVMSQTAGIASNEIHPQIVIPQAAWQYFEQTARGADADLVLQRLQSTLELETRRTVHFVDGQLKGTVYYNSYTSPQGGNTGAVLSIAPGATSPTLAVQPSGKCTVCHSMNLDGTKLIANGGRSTNSYEFNQSRRYDMTTVSTPASPQVLNDYNDAISGDFTPGDYDAQGDRYTFGAPWLDGSLYLTHGGEPTYGGDRNWRAPNDYSKFYRPSSGTLVSPSNWTNISGITPRFSVDGKRLAFGFWGASGSTLPCSSNAIAPCTTSGPRTLSPASGGTRLVVVDFASPATPSSSTGWVVSNARDVTPGVAEKVAWPAFTPDGNSVLYQRQYRTSRSGAANGGALTDAWSPSDINTVGGALAEIWMSNVPSDGSTTATPTRLSALNGLNGATSYLPGAPPAAYPVDRFSGDMSQTVTSGAAGPAVTLTGTARNGPRDVRIKPATSAARGTATFTYSTDGGVTWSSALTTQATVALGSTGLTAAFGTGSNYNKNSTYKALVGQVEITGTPAASYDVRVNIYSTTGPRGTAKFRYSTDGGSTWSATLTTAASVLLGSTGLTATFSNVTYESTSWTYGATAINYHRDNASFPITWADNCARTGTASSVYDYRLNYLPAVAPTEAGGYNWVVFTSRRMYGNIATNDPWDAEPGYSCNSGEPPTKKLWMAAVDKNWTPGTDPSHPAFYMPGQELVAGNSNGYWVNVQCSALNASCTTDEDCCGGTGTDKTAKCSVVSTATVPPTCSCQSYNSCSAVGEDCSTGADCCTGLVCPTGGGECVSLPSPVYEVQNLEREYTASCPYGTTAAWRFFEWQATVPAGSSIDFAIQTKQLPTDTYKPTIALAMASATASTPAGKWERGPNTAGQVMKAASVTPGNNLRVTMTFNPDATGSVAPTLLNWRQVFDCLPAQ